MNIKNILSAGLICFGVALGFTGCSDDDDPYFTASGDDAPRILNTDIPEGKKGEPGTLSTIMRDQNFTYEVIVTPVSTSQVEWYVDGEKVADGKTIDIALLAGEHIVKIVAKTAGGETYREVKVVVNPLESDPNPGNKPVERNVKPGASCTLSGSNLSDIKQILIGGKTVNCTYNSKGYLEYTMPADLAEGTYQMTLIDSKGAQFGGGAVNVSQNPVVEAEEIEIWKGEYAVTWSNAFQDLKDLSLSLIADGTIKAGTTIRAYVTGSGQGCIATADWTGAVTGGKEDKRGDVMITADTKCIEAKLSENSIKLLSELWGMIVCGDGFTVTRVTIQDGVPGDEPEPQPEPEPEPEPAGLETVLFEGAFEVSWTAGPDNSAVALNDIKAKTKQLAQDGVIKAGTVLRIYTEGAGSGGAATAWWRGILTGGEGEERGDMEVSEGNNVMTYVLTEDAVARIKEQDGIIVVGDGFTIKRITIETAIWEGSFEVSWTAGPDNSALALNDVKSITKQYAQDGVIKAGTILRIYTEGAGAGGAATAWWRGLITGGEGEERGDVQVADNAVITYELTEDAVARIKEQDGIIVIGDGFTIKSITIE